MLSNPPTQRSRPAPRTPLDRAAGLFVVVAALATAACDDAGDTAPDPVIDQASALPSAEPPVQSVTPPAPPPPPAPEYESEDLPEPDLATATLDEQREAMLRRMRKMGAADDAQVAALKEIIFATKHMGQGNPAVVEHPMTQTQCMEKRKQLGVKDEKKPQCGAPFMVPIYDPSKEKEADAKVCIDRFEFPGLPCEYPVTWVTTKQAQQLCQALGKRICDAHEWEGACAGAVLPAEEEYAFGRPRDVMRNMHNNRREILWTYGPKEDQSQCATGSKKSKKCTSSGWRPCGSNTYPAGSFPGCSGKFHVYDLHGNAAEHMALPLKKEELGREGGFGQPEMKGSWFIFQSIHAHEDDCRWRAPKWHDNEGKNHANYHLGFRCCKDMK